jgi:hypothetical protein
MNAGAWILGGESKNSLMKNENRAFIRRAISALLKH